MGLLDSLQIGASGLIAQQAALQITGNNIANAATPGYARQIATLSSAGQSSFGNGITGGGGVELSAVRRAVDVALNARLYSANGQVAQHEIAEQTLSRIESLMNEMTDTDLSSALMDLFNSFSALSQSPQDSALRGIVLQRAATLVERFNHIREGLEQMRLDLTEQVEGAVVEADRLADAIAKINLEIVSAEANGSTAASLRDQRDGLVSQLSELIGVTTREEDSGALNVYIGSEPLVYRTECRGLKMTRQLVNGQPADVVTFADNEGAIKLTGGRITGLQGTRDGRLADIVSRLDTLAGQVIWQVNRLHSQGTALEGFTELHGTYQIEDSAVALNNAASGLKFLPRHGSFLITVTNTVTGQTDTRQIDVNLTGGAGDTTANDLVAALNAVGGVSAGIDAGGKLVLETIDANMRMSFSADTSGVLAALGVNTFFEGSTASDIGVNAFVAADGARIAAGLSGQPGDGGAAAALAALADTKVSEVGGMTLQQYHQRLVADVAVWTSAAADTAAGGRIVRESLSAQRESISGVSLDEEAVNLIRYQRAFQGSARFITVVDELLDTLLSLA